MALSSSWLALVAVLLAAATVADASSASDSLYLVDTFSLRNACVSYRFGQSEGEFISLDGVPALLSGFSEVTSRWHRLSHVRLPNSMDAPMLAQAERRPLGLVLQYASFNMYHQLWHILAAWSSLNAHAAASTPRTPMHICNHIS